MPLDRIKVVVGRQEWLDPEIGLGILDVRATLCLTDARHLSSPRHREHPNFLDQIHLADVLIANKRDHYTSEDRTIFEDFASTLQPRKQRVACVTRGYVDLAWLDLSRSSERRAAFPEAHAFLVDNGADTPAQPHATVLRGYLLPFAESARALLARPANRGAASVSPGRGAG